MGRSLPTPVLNKAGRFGEWKEEPLIIVPGRPVLYWEGRIRQRFQHSDTCEGDGNEGQLAPLSSRSAGEGRAGKTKQPP